MQRGSISCGPNSSTCVLVNFVVPSSDAHDHEIQEIIWWFFVYPMYFCQVVKLKLLCTEKEGLKFKKRNQLKKSNVI